MIIVSDRVENISGKGKNACYQLFSLSWMYCKAFSHNILFQKEKQREMKKNAGSWTWEMGLLKSSWLPAFSSFPTLTNKVCNKETNQ